MPILTYKNNSFQGNESETILECLVRNGQSIPNSCRGGICQSCLMKTENEVDSISQKGLSSGKKEAGLFMSCQQLLKGDFEVFRADESTSVVEGEIIVQERITDSVVILSIKLASNFSYFSGQFVNLIRHDDFCRSYSLASVSSDKVIKLHIRKMPNGVMSTWLYDAHLIGEKVKINGPIGECYLNQEMFDDNLLLVGVGTGLAPLFGIIHDAISRGFNKKMALFHGGLFPESLYLIEELKNLESTHPQFSYHPTFLKGEEREGFIKGDLIEVLKKTPIETKNTTVMVCGDPEMVKKIKQTIFMKGVPSKKIFSDSFLVSRPKN